MYRRKAADFTNAWGSIIVASNIPQKDRAQEDDVGLVRRAKSGDLAAYGLLVERHQRSVYGIVSRMIAGREDVDDVVQDVFVQAYRSISRFRGDSAFSTWLHSIAVNMTIRHIRKSKIRQSVSIDDPSTGFENTLESSDAEAPEDAALIEERKALVRAAVDNLPEKQRTVVVLHYFEDYSCEEIAKILNCSVGTVWSRLHYACRKLRGHLNWLETA